MTAVTISRQYGSEGDEIAARVCDKLGYKTFDRRLIEQVASEVGLTVGEVVDFSEDEHKVRGFVDRLLRGRKSVNVTRVWTEDRAGVRTQDVMKIDETGTITLVQSVVKAACRQGHVVIVGRGGQVILQGEAGVLHVRIVAPLDLRARRVQLQEGISYERACDVIAKRDAAAADYVRRFYGVDSSDPLLYHLVINTGRWNIEGAAQLIVDAVHCLAPVAAPN